MTESDVITLLKWTVLQEAGGEPTEVQIGVAWVLRNRHDLWGRGWARVCLKAYQFSCWNTESPTRMLLDTTPDTEMVAVQSVVEGVLNGTTADNTQGAAYYLNEAETIKEEGRLPDWTRHYRKTVQLGKLSFYAS